MTHLRALRIHGEMREMGMRAFIAKRKNGKRWEWVVIYPSGSANMEFEAAAQWNDYKAQAVTR